MAFSPVERRGKAVRMHRSRSVLSVTAPQAESLSRCYTHENTCRVSRGSKIRQREFAWRGVCQSKCKSPPRAVTVTSDKVSKADLRASAAAVVAVSPAAASVSYTTTEDYHREFATREGTSWLTSFALRSIGSKRRVRQLSSRGSNQSGPNGLIYLKEN